MRILIDECLPRRLTKELTGHEAKTVQQMGWSKKTNGELLTLMKQDFEVFITIDTNLAFQQNLKNLPLAVVVLRAHSNKIEDIRPLMPQVLSALNSISAGQVVSVGA